MAGRARTIRDLLALLVAITLVGAMVVGTVGSDRATAATTTTHRVTIPFLAFIPNGDAGTSVTAPVPFYRPGNKVTVMNMTLFATDNHTAAVCASLLRSTPADGSDQFMAGSCSSGQAPGVRGFQVSVPSPRGVTAYQGAYIWLTFNATGPQLRVHGVRITYRVTE